MTWYPVGHSARPPSTTVARGRLPPFGKPHSLGPATLGHEKRPLRATVTAVDDEAAVAGRASQTTLNL